MRILVQLEPHPDAAYWPGRKPLAVIDAAVWPSIWVAIVMSLNMTTGVAGLLVTALVMLGVDRVYTAVAANHRYRFTTWRWGWPLGAFWLVWMIVKLVLDLILR